MNFTWITLLLLLLYFVFFSFFFRFHFNIVFHFRFGCMHVQTVVDSNVTQMASGRRVCSDMKKFLKLLMLSTTTTTTNPRKLQYTPFVCAFFFVRSFYYLCAENKMMKCICVAVHIIIIARIHTF